MTDREKLLVSTLSGGGAEPDGMVSELEVIAMLYELGHEYRRRPGCKPARVPTHTPTRIVA